MSLKSVVERGDFDYDLRGVTISIIDVGRPASPHQPERVAEDDLAPAAGILNGLVWSTGMWAVGVVAYWYAINAG